MKRLICNASVLDNVNPVFTGSLLINGNQIERVMRQDRPELDVDEVVDATGYLIIPGMTNAHYHSYSNVLKGTINNLPLELWSLYTIAYGYSLEDEDIELSVLLGAIEMIKNGITSCVDHFPHIRKAESALLAYESSGMRVGFAPMLHDVYDHRFLKVNLPNHLKESLEEGTIQQPVEMKSYYKNLITRWHKRRKRIELIVGPNAPQRCSDDMLEACRFLSETYDLSVHTHLLETRRQLSNGVETFPGGIIGRLRDHNLLNSKLFVAHGVMMNQSDSELLAEQRVTMIHNPASNLILGSGIAPVTSWLANKMTIGLGTDASNCGIKHSLFEAMRLSIMMQRMRETDYQKWLQAEDAWQMAVKGGASASSQTLRTGEITEGAEADLVFLKKDTLALTPLQNIIQQLVFQESGDSVDSVMITGNWVMRNRRLITINEEEVMKRIRERSARLMENSRSAVLLADELAPFFK